MADADLRDIQLLEELALPLRPRRDRRVFRERMDYFRIYNDRGFSCRFRVSKQTANYIIAQVADQIAHATNKNHCITCELQVLTCLRFFATGSYQRVAGDLGGVSAASVCRILRRVSEAIASLKQHYIVMPDAVEAQLMKQHFHRMAGFPGVTGCIDGTHIRIAYPTRVPNAAIYMNRKGFYSLNVQMVCDYKMQIRNVVVRSPGSTHDSRIFQNSTLRDRLEDGRVDGILLGDNGYACERFLLTPILRPTTDAERRYNTAHKRTRNIIERIFGVLKRRFPCIGLDSRLRCHLETSKAVVVSLCVLHNITRDNGDRDFEQDDPIGNEFDIPGYQDAPRGLAFRQAVIQNHFA